MALTINLALLLVFLLLLPLESRIRKPAVSGKWYPSGAAELKSEIAGYLRQAELTEAQKHLEPLGIVVPHAGYMFSAPVAACCYKLLETRHYDTVIMIGSSHHYFRGVVSVYNGDSLQTPLGNTPVDMKLVKYLTDSSENITCDYDIHMREHSNEAQLPFLQYLLEDFKAVSILTSTNSDRILQETADALIKYVKGSSDKILFVISTDMSHFHSYETARSMDKHTLDLITEEKWEELDQKLSIRECELCGSMALDIFRRIYKELDGEKPQVLHYANSGDAHPEYGLEEVVGYGALVFPRKKEKTETALGKKEKTWLLQLARKSIEDELRGSREHPELIEADIFKEKRAVFVTLHKNGELRGCIGHMEAREPLWQAVQEMARSAAFNDPRFASVQLDELAQIEIEISVLTPMQRINSVDEIVMGRDGVMIKRGYHSGVFLPQVARETGWDKETFLRQLCAGKAYLAPDAYLDPETEIYVFQVEEFSE